MGRRSRWHSRTSRTQGAALGLGTTGAPPDGGTHGARSPSAAANTGSWHKDEQGGKLLPLLQGTTGRGDSSRLKATEALRAQTRCFRLTPPLKV